MEPYAEQWRAAAAVLRAHAEKFDDLAAKAPPAPVHPDRRSGGLMDCGCWWFAPPGSQAGRTMADCPLHGRVRMKQANVDEPYRKWVQ